MNRFEQTRPPIGSTLIKLFSPIVFLILLLIFLTGIRSVSDTTTDKQKESLEVALKRSIAQCYAVEGVYPPSLDYLIDHYGIVYDTDSFVVDYDFYGSNLMPDVSVMQKSRNNLKVR